jgi:uncharacterized membrane protein YesL
MMKLNINNPFFEFMNTFAEFVLLNLLWVAFCIPVFTIGAATTALFHVTMQTARGEHGYVARTFIKSFRENFKQSTLIWIATLLLGAVLLFNLSFWFTFKTTIGYLILFVVGVFTLLFIFTVMYVFPLSARFANSIKHIIKNALMISLWNIKYTILLLIFNSVLLVTVYFIHSFAVFLVVFGFAFIAYIQSFIYVKIFKKYEPDNESEDQK